MTIYKTIRCLVLLAGFAALSQTAAFAQGTVTGTSTTTANLGMSATAQTVLTLDIATNGGAAVTGTAGSGAFAVSLGNVNGLGVGTPTSGVTVATTPAGATYTTPITLMPTFSGFVTATAVINVNYAAASGNPLGNAAVREGAAADSVAALTATPAAAIAAVSTGVGYSRYVGFFVSNVNGAGAVNGALASTVVYTIVASP